MDWEQVQEIFAAAIELPPEKRSAYLDTTGADPEVRSEVERLLVHHDAPGAFLDKPLLPRPLTDLLPQDWTPDYVEDPDRIGPYRLRQLIGEGGMGAVYLATRDDEEFQREVAIKLIRRSPEQEALVRFRTERQILAGLEHPNIARLYDGGTAEDGRPFLVMEYVEGVRLDTYASQANLDLEARLQLFVQVCAAVAYAHRNLLVHRDLKPANILVTADGVPKLLDFGIAKSLESGQDTGATRPGESPMTPAYASRRAGVGWVLHASSPRSVGCFFRGHGSGMKRTTNTLEVLMKKSNPHLRLNWKFDLAIIIPIDHERTSSLVNRILIGACAVTLAIGLVPLAALLLAGP